MAMLCSIDSQHSAISNLAGLIEQWETWHCAGSSTAFLPDISRRQKRGSDDGNADGTVGQVTWLDAHAKASADAICGLPASLSNDVEASLASVLNFLDKLVQNVATMGLVFGVSELFDKVIELSENLRNTIETTATNTLDGVQALH